MSRMRDKWHNAIQKQQEEWKRKFFMRDEQSQTKKVNLSTLEYYPHIRNKKIFNFTGKKLFYFFPKSDMMVAKH